MYLKKKQTKKSFFNKFGYSKMCGQPYVKLKIVSTKFLIFEIFKKVKCKFNVFKNVILTIQFAHRTKYVFSVQFHINLF